MTNQNSITHTLFKSLEDLLNGGNAHVSLDKALQNIPLGLLGKKPATLPYTIWQLTEHIRIAQWDLLEFSYNRNHVSPNWPEGYWPSEKEPTSKSAWEKCIRQIKSDRKKFIELLAHAGEDIYKPFNYGNGQSLLKEALVLADHNSYHTGEIIIVRRLLNDWGK
ncbi:MAG: DinB family protein [Ginsengibacter sp.]